MIFIFYFFVSWCHSKCREISVRLNLDYTFDPQRLKLQELRSNLVRIFHWETPCPVFFHSNSSLLCKAFKGMDKISHRVLGANNSCTFCLFHWPVCSSISSLTSIFDCSSPVKTGLCVSQLSTATLKFFYRPPTFHCDHALIMSLAASRLRQT